MTTWTAQPSSLPVANSSTPVSPATESVIGRAGSDASLAGGQSLDHLLGPLLTTLPEWKLELTNYPVWGQLVDWTWSGASDVNRQYNCIPESVAQAIMYLRGVELPASWVKDVEYSEQYTGYTDLQHAQHFLAAVGHLGSNVYFADTSQSWQWRMFESLKRGHPFLGLYSFSAPGAADGHCRGTVYMDNLRIVTADPWTNNYRIENYDENWAWAKGTALVVEATRWHV